MLAIKLNNTYLDLKENSTASFSLNNPLFDDTYVARDFTLPITLSLTPKNCNLLESPHRLDGKGKRVFENATLYIENIPYKRGVLEIKSATDKDVKVIFKDENRTNIEALEKLRLKEILGFDLVSSTIATQSVFDIIPNYSQYSITVEGITFVYNPNFNDTQAIVSQQLSSLINAQLPNHAIWQVGQTQLIIDNNELPAIHPFIFLIGLTIAENATTGQTQNTKTIDYVKNIVNNPVETHAFPTLYWLNYYEGRNTKFQNWVNYYLDNITIENELETQAAGEEASKWKHTYIPFLYVKYIVKQIAAQLNLTLDESDFFSIAEMNQLLLFNNKSIDYVYKNLVPIDSYINGFDSFLHFGNHVPDLSALEFLNNLAEKFGLHIDFKESKLFLKFKKSQFEQSATNWTEKASPEYDIDFFEEEADGIKFGEEAKQDKFKIDTQLLPYIVGNGRNKKITAFGSAYMETQGTLRVPTIDQKGSTPLNGDNDYDLRLLLYRGKQTSLDNKQYPLASHEKTNALGQMVGNISLDPTFLYQNYHSQILQLEGKRLITKEMRLDINDLLKIETWKNTRILIRQEEGIVQGIIKSVKFKANATGISTSILEIVSEL